MSAALAGLDAHARRLAGASLPDLIDDDPRRARDISLRVGPMYANFARQRYDRLALDALFALAEARDLPGAMRRLLDGGIVNPTEGRAALHTALRGDASTGLPSIHRSAASQPTSGFHGSWIRLAGSGLAKRSGSAGDMSSQVAKPAKPAPSCCIPAMALAGTSFARWFPNRSV